MRRSFRLAYSAAAAAGLLGGAGAALGAVPGGRATALPVAVAVTAPVPSTTVRATGDAEIAQLRSDLERMAGAGRLLREKVAAMEVDLSREAKLRHQRAAALAVQQVAAQRVAVRLAAAATAAGPASPATHTNTGASGGKAATYPPAPPTHTKTGASGGSTAKNPSAPPTHTKTGASGGGSAGTGNGGGDGGGEHEGHDD